MTKPKEHIDLQTRIKAVGLNFSGFGKLLGRPRTTVYQWTSGGTPIPDYVRSMLSALEAMSETKRRRFCADFGVTIEEKEK